ncbi:MAG: aldehyde dehydrogenase family protein, partial [Chloroflexota bacterium]
DKGAIPLYAGALDASLLLPGQDRSAYVAPSAFMNVPQNCALHHREPFGPVDTVVVVDRIDQLVAEMNVSNGNLVASVACDDIALAQRVSRELRAFKIGINKTRSRGDREEVFGGIGESWKGCFVGGEYLVQAVTIGPEGTRPYGNFTDLTLLPEVR